MLDHIIPDFPFNDDPERILKAGREYAGDSNPYGAICGICSNGSKLGVKPGEFEFLSAPEWVLRKWVGFDNRSGDSALELLREVRS